MSADKIRLLLVDDDEDFRTSMKEALEGAGFEVQCAAHGQEASRRLAEGGLPDVILLDLVMPVMNGWRFCEWRRQNPGVCSVPVIAMSAAVSKDPASPYYLDVDDYVTKPVDLDDLLAKIAAQAERSSPSQSKRSSEGPQWPRP